MSSKNIYIYNLPWPDYDKLVKILNSGDAWKKLGGNHLGYSKVDLDHFGSWVHKTGGSPADAMLTDWGKRNPTTKQLFKHLHQMEHFQAMDVLKPYVDEKYHSAFSTKFSRETDVKVLNVHQSSPGAGFSGQMPPAPPPYDYNQARALSQIQHNLDYEPPKANAAKFADDSDFTIIDSVSENPKVSVGQWSAQKTQPINFPTVPTQNPMTSDILANPNVVPELGKSPNTLRTSRGASQEGSWPGSMGTETASRLRHLSNSTNIDNVPNLTGGFQNVPFNELFEACNGFSMGQENQENFLGRGGFGEVYKGFWRGQDIAVKKLRKEKLTSVDGDVKEKFIATIFTELKVMHQFPCRFILPLMGMSYSEDMLTDPCLVYEYMPNGSVSDKLKRKNGTTALTWTQRANIAEGTARGLQYLHSQNPPIIHGDIKSPNILLDVHFEPRIGDFGLARGGAIDTTKSHRTITNIHGTKAYLPDDYVRSYQLHPAVDTYCYGITLFELVTGKSPSMKCSNGLTMKENMREATTPHLWVDKSVEISQWVSLLFFFGKDCTQERRKKRPEMSKVVEGFLSAKKLHFFRPMPIQMQEHYDRKNINQPASDLSPKKEVSSVMGEEKNSGQEDPHDSSSTSKTPTHDISAIESPPKIMIPDMSAIGETSSEFIRHLKNEESKSKSKAEIKGGKVESNLVPAILMHESCGAIPDIPAILQSGAGDDEDTDLQYSSTTGFDSELSETSTECSQSENIAIDGMPELSDHLRRMMSANIQEFSRSNVQK